MFSLLHDFNLFVTVPAIKYQCGFVFVICLFVCLLQLIVSLVSVLVHLARSVSRAATDAS